VLLGQGGGGGALALLPADRVLCAQHGWLSPLPPEGASAILHRTTERAPEVARRRACGSLDLLRDGIVDRSSPSTPTPPTSRTPSCAGSDRRSSTSWSSCCSRTTSSGRAERFRRYRALGTGTRS
jgi:acetyl-CoA carboxylase carboxyl transferase subunit beta